MNEMEKDGISRLIEYLEVVEVPHGNASSFDKLKNDFDAFFTQYDKRRNKNLLETFPGLKK